MMFKNQIKRGAGVLNRGDRCLYRTVDAWYMGSFKNEDDIHWNHMLLVQQVMDGEIKIIEEFLVTTQDARDIVFKKMMPDILEGQMQLC